MAGTDEVSVFLEYLVTLSENELLHLHRRPSTTLFLFRLLPAITQQIVVKLIWNSNVGDLRKHEKLQQFTHYVKLLLDLKIAHYSGENLAINNDFRRSYLHAVMLGAQRCAGLLPSDSDVKKKTSNISKKSTERWECILKYLALPSEQNMSAVSKETRELFKSAGFTSSSVGEIEITSTGFQFLLLSTVQQMWTYIREYLKMEAEKGSDVLELIELLVRIILCIDKSNDPARSCFLMDDSWTSKQKEMINHLRELGLVFVRKSKDGFFFLTPLLWNLSVGREQEVTEDRKSGNVIVETNFRLYAYTDSSLQLAILSTFTEMTYRFNDMCVGILSRESVRRALQVGITAAQIVSFLRTNSHSQCVANRGPINCLPITVADQIRLWEDERKRLNLVDAVFYTSFDTEREYTGVRDFSLENDILQYADNQQQLIIVTEEGHNLVRQWWKDNKPV